MTVKMRVHTIPQRRRTATIPHSNCYAVETEDGRIALVDPGTDMPGNWEALVEGLTGFGHRIDDVAVVCSTHLHSDHMGLANRVRSETGALVALHIAEQRAILELGSQVRRYPEELEAWGVPTRLAATILESFVGQDTESALDADLLVVDGDPVAPGMTELVVVATPGHTPGHICLVDQAGRRLFAGDHLLPEIVPGVGLGGAFDRNPIAVCFDSLARVEQYDGFEILPGHEYGFDGVIRRAEEIRRHHLRRTAEAAAAVAAHPAESVYGIASRLPWSKGWDGLPGRHLYSALNQTAFRMEFAASREYAIEVARRAPRRAPSSAEPRSALDRGPTTGRREPRRSEQQ